MSQLEIITSDQAEEWNKIVKSFKNHDIYYLIDYVKAFQIHGDGEPVLIFYHDHDFKAMNVTMKRDIGRSPNLVNKIPIDTYYDFTTPYGYGGFLFEGTQTKENIETLNRIYCEYCIEHNIVCEFARFHPVLENARSLTDFYEVTELGETILMDLSNQEVIWRNIISKNRNMIRKAQKSGVKIYWGRNPELFEIFTDIYNETMDKDKADSYYYFKPSFYKSVLDDLKDNSLIFYAQLENEIIAMSTILFCNQQMHYHLSASRQAYLRYAPTNLLLYEAACWGTENGFKTLHLGGGLGSCEDSLYKFKRAFNRNSDVRFSIGKKIFINKIYKELKLLNIFKNNKSYFPEYRG